MLVYGPLLQDIVTAPLPNGAFWSIGLEALLYLLFPLLLLIRRRGGPVTLLATVTVPVVAIGLLHPTGSPVNQLTGLTPLFTPLFAVGMVGAGVLAAGEPVRGLGRFSYSLHLIHLPIVLVVSRELPGRASAPSRRALGRGPTAGGQRSSGMTSAKVRMWSSRTLM